MVVDASALQRPVSDDAGDSSFPWILDVLEIQPFDFFKVIDSFIKADANLPSSVVKVSSGVSLPGCRCSVEFMK